MDYAENVKYASLAGKVVVITGGANGFGEELVRSFVSQCSKVAFLDYDKEAGEKLAKELECLFLFFDVTNTKLLQNCFKEVSKYYGTIDILVNNAGSDDHHTIDELTEEYFDNRINMGSITWMRDRPGYECYSLSKAAIHGFTRTLAQ